MCASPRPDDDELLAARAVCQRLGDISLMTLWRWCRSDIVRFPPPDIRINARRYWRKRTIGRWESQQSERSRGM